MLIKNTVFFFFYNIFICYYNIINKILIFKFNTSISKFLIFKIYIYIHIYLIKFKYICLIIYTHLLNINILIIKGIFIICIICIFISNSFL